jgi:hypothetical protein
MNQKKLLSINAMRMKNEFEAESTSEIEKRD